MTSTKFGYSQPLTINFLRRYYNISMVMQVLILVCFLFSLPHPTFCFCEYFCCCFRYFWFFCFAFVSGSVSATIIETHHMASSAVWINQLKWGFHCMTCVYTNKSIRKYFIHLTALNFPFLTTWQNNFCNCAGNILF